MPFRCLISLQVDHCSGQARLPCIHYGLALAAPARVGPAVIEWYSMISSPTAGSLHSSPRLAAQISRTLSASLFRRLVVQPVGGIVPVVISETASSNT